MASFLLAAKGVFPMFLWILLGFTVKNAFRVNEKFFKVGNKFVFTVLLPVAIFNNVASAHVKNVVQPKLIIFAVLAISTVFICSWFFVKKTEPDIKKHGSMIQGTFRSNFVLFGMPLVINIYSLDDAGVTSFMIAIIVPIFNVFSTFTLETNRIDRPAEKIKPSVILISIAKNPLIIGSLVGLLFLLMSIPVPGIIEAPLQLFSKTCSPIALFFMGGAFKVKSIAEDRKRLTIVVLMRLILWPFLIIVSAVLLGFRDVELVTLLAFAAAPAAVNSYTMAEIMGNDGPFAASIVVFTTLFASVTVFLFVFTLSSLGFIAKVA